MALFAGLWRGGRARRRRRARAMAHVRRGLTLDPESLTGHLLAAYLYAAVRATTLAQVEFRWVLRCHPAHPRALLRLEHVRPPEDGCELVLARLDGSLLAGTPGGIRDLDAAACGLVVLRLAAAALARAGFGALRRAVVENSRGADFARSDGELVLALSMPRHTEWSPGLLQVNRLWVGALHELGQAAPHRKVS
ncbi:MAG: hypothetical protein ACRELS_07590 [Candidatus Rokuibacteriota bacterium]